MASRAVSEWTEHEPPETGRLPLRERAPSRVVHGDEPRLARWVGTVGLFFVAVGIIALLFHLGGSVRRVGPGLGVLSLVVGLGCMLFHAAMDAELQVRRTYGVFGVGWLLVGIVMSMIPTAAGTHFVPYGFVGLLLGLFFLMPFVRQETDVRWRNSAVWTVGALAAVMAVTAFVGGNVSQRFLMPYGLLLGLLGLAYGWAFVGMEGAATNLGYRAGVGLGVLGGLGFLVAFGRSAIPALLYRWHWLGARPEPYLVPSGLLLMGLALLYLGLSVGLCWDNRFVVLTRRELAAYFYSPIAYIVLFAMTVIGLWNYLQWVGQFLIAGEMEQSTQFAEPILQTYIISWWPVIVMLVVVPLLTMSLLSEEKRSGTLEVLLTAPVGETAVVLSKFLAAFIFFFVAFVPWWLYLVAFRVEGGQPFEYRPLLSFGIALACTGAGFLAMGEFFSGVSRNQIVAFILGFAGMLLLLAVFFIRRILQGSNPDSPWIPVLGQISYVDLWWTSMEGVLAPRYLVFHVSAAIFWLFLTVKVLESRKWR